MTIIDISWPITPAMTAYKDKKTVRFEHTKEFDRDNARESVITLGSHSGTHIDAPSHFLREGATIDNCPLDATVGPCRVIDLTRVSEYITEADLSAFAFAKHEIVLFKTSNSTLQSHQLFERDFVYLAAGAAEYLVSCNIKAVGIDYLGIERNQPGHETHTRLLSNGIAIIEGLRLAHVPEGRYTLWCLPLAVQGLEAAPARAVLITE